MTKKKPSGNFYQQVKEKIIIHMKEKYQNERFKNIWGTCVSYLE
jgi:hypothetical protein